MDFYIYDVVALHDHFLGYYFEGGINEVEEELGEMEGSAA